MRNIQPTGAVDAGIREKVAKLERFSPDIMSCRVTVEQNGRHHTHGREISVRIDLRIPGGVIEIMREHDENFCIALRDAFRAARRKLADIQHKRSEARPQVPEAPITDASNEIDE